MTYRWREELSCRLSIKAKAMAKRLRSALAANTMDVTHGTSLELVAAQLGHRDWNTAAAKLASKHSGQISFEQAIPIFRIFDVTKAREFYCDFLGFTVTMEHRHEPSLPLYMGIERAGFVLHLSEHHGDASPGSTAFVWMEGRASFPCGVDCKELRLWPPRYRAVAVGRSATGA